MHTQAAPPIGLIIGILIFVVVFGLRMRRMMRPSPFNPYLAWILPVIFVVLSGLLLFNAKPAGTDWLWAVGAFALGTVVGYFRGRSITMTIDPVTRKVVAQGSAMAMVFIVVLLGARYGLRYLLTTEAGALNLRPIMADVLSAVLGAGIFVARGAEMGLRGHRMLEAAKLAPPTADRPLAP